MRTAPNEVCIFPFWGSQAPSVKIRTGDSPCPGVASLGAAILNHRTIHCKFTLSCSVSTLSQRRSK
eukprot:2374183-Amphidinium_carterae.1